MTSALGSRVILLACGLLLTLGSGCGDTDDNPAVPAGGTVEGDYTISLTNRENGCDFDDWTTGEST